MARSYLPSVIRTRPRLGAALGACFISFSGILVRLSGLAPSASALWRCVYAIPFLVLLSRFERRDSGRRSSAERRAAALAGVFFALDLVMWHHSIRAVGAGLATVLGNMQVVFVPLIAWSILRERLQKRVLLSVPLILLGLVLISGAVGSGAYGEDPLLGAVLGVLTAVAYSGFILVMRHGNSDMQRPAGILLDATVVAAAVTAIAAVVLGELELPRTLESNFWLVLLALSAQVAGWVLISISLPKLPAAVTSILLMIQPVAAVVLSRWLLDETPSAAQLAGVAVTLAAILIATSARAASPAEHPETLEGPARQ